MPNSAVDNQIPYELWHGKCLNYHDFHYFECIAVVYNEEGTAKSADPKGIECKFLCISSNKKGYVLLSVSDNRLIEIGNVAFMKGNINETIPQCCPDSQTDSFGIEWEAGNSIFSDDLIGDSEPVQQPIECNEPTFENDNADTHIDQQPDAGKSSYPAAKTHPELSTNDEAEMDHLMVDQTQETVVQFSVKELQQFVNETLEATVQELAGQPTFDKSNCDRSTKK